MEIKEINKIIQSEDKDEKSKSVKCICINYGDFLADCEGFFKNHKVIFDYLFKSSYMPV